MPAYGMDIALNRKVIRCMYASMHVDVYLLYMIVRHLCASFTKVII